MKKHKEFLNNKISASNRENIFLFVLFIATIAFTIQVSKEVENEEYKTNPILIAEHTETEIITLEVINKYKSPLDVTLINHIYLIELSNGMELHVPSSAHMEYIIGQTYEFVLYTVTETKEYVKKVAEN